MKAENFIIGYIDDSAIIDKKAKRVGKNLTAAQLFERQMYCASFRKALESDDKETIEKIKSLYSQEGVRSYEENEDLIRLFGLYFDNGNLKTREIG